MNNTDKHIEELITKFHQANLTPDELEHLYTYFLAAKNVPEQWKADAAILRQLAVQHHCQKKQHILENKLKQLQQEEQKHNRKQLWTYTYRIAACVLPIILWISFSITNNNKFETVVINEKEFLFACNNDCSASETLEQFLTTIK